MLNDRHPPRTHVYVHKRDRRVGCGRSCEAPAFLTDEQYERLILAVTAVRAGPGQLVALRDLAIVLTLGDGGLRREELCALERSDFLPRRQGSLLRALQLCR